jgi:hypothetical protein
MVEFMVDPTHTKHGLGDIKTEEQALELCNRLLNFTPR